MRALVLVGLLAARAAAAETATVAPELPVATPEAVGLDSAGLVGLTEWIRDNPLPLFSLLISRDGKLVYELYPAGVERDQAHYLMSVTKSFLSLLVGLVLDDKKIAGPDAPIVDTLPRALFADDAARARFAKLTVRQVMGMSALDAPDPPRSLTPESLKRLHDFNTAPNRVRYALTQALLPEPGRSFQYNDVTPALAAGLVQYAEHQGAFELASARVFAPLGFRNAEWMHQDPSGLDNGGYGLRVRPIDMQKLGLLFLDGGVWRGRRIVSREWVERSWQPWNRSRGDARAPDYGWFWWAGEHAGRVAHEAHGWKGQRIAVFPDARLVVTMTGCIEDGREFDLFDGMLTKFILPSVRDQPLPPAPARAAQLAAVMADFHRNHRRVASWIEPRMVPSVAPKAARVRFLP